MIKKSFQKTLAQRFRGLLHIFKHYKLYKMFLGVQTTQAVLAAVKLNLADHLSGGALTCEELAAKTDVDATCLDSLMKLLTKAGFVASLKSGGYKLTSMGASLTSDAPDSMKGMAAVMSDIVIPTWNNLARSVKTGEDAFSDVFQMSLYEYLEQNPESDANFNLSMEESTRDWILPTLDMLNLSDINTFADIGGGTGVLTAMILKKYPRLRGVLFDQEHIVAKSDKILESAGVAGRCRVKAGNFLESVPKNNDLYIIARVLLNWDDENAVKILKNCRAAMNASAKLLIIDFIPPKKTMNPGLLAGKLNTLVFSGRLLRAKDECFNLLSQAGFQYSRLIKTGGMINFIEAA